MMQEINTQNMEAPTRKYFAAKLFLILRQNRRKLPAKKKKNKAIIKTNDTKKRYCKYGSLQQSYS